MISDIKINSLTLSRGETGSLACIPRTLGEVSLEVKVTSRMKKILGACNWRLIVYEGGYAASDVEQPLQVLTPLLVMIVILAISQGPELLLVYPFRVIRIVIIGGEGRVHLARAWAMMLWAGL